MLKLQLEDDVVAAGCWRNDEPIHEWDLLRSEAICIPLIEAVIGWINEHDIECLEVCIETPFYNTNAQILMKQMYLFVLLQKYVWDYLVPILDEVYLTTVHNTTSKSKLTGDGRAKKHQMVEASPWNGKHDITFNQGHTLADAYAHALSGGYRQWALHKLDQYMVEANYEETT